MQTFKHSRPHLVLRLLVLATFIVGFLAGAHIFPDPCFAADDSCCTEESEANLCHTPCCAGLLATAEVSFRLAVPLATRPAIEAIALLPEFTPLDPLVRPPIAS